MGNEHTGNKFAEQSLPSKPRIILYKKTHSEIMFNVSVRGDDTLCNFKRGCERDIGLAHWKPMPLNFFLALQSKPSVSKHPFEARTLDSFANKH